MKNEKNIFQKFLNIVSWLFLGAFLVALVFTAISNLNFSGGYKSLIVQSGSMEPSIMAGDVIIIAKESVYQKNDVVTFTDAEGYTTTHRIIDKTSNSNKIVTQGDANRVQDNEEITQEQILGKVILTIPKLGFFLSFIRSGKGLLIFVFIPALLIVIDEISHIYKAVKEKKNVS